MTFKSSSFSDEVGSIEGVAGVGFFFLERVFWGWGLVNFLAQSFDFPPSGTQRTVFLSLSNCQSALLYGRLARTGVPSGGGELRRHKSMQGLAGRL